MQFWNQEYFGVRERAESPSRAQRWVILLFSVASYEMQRNTLSDSD